MGSELNPCPLTITPGMKNAILRIIDNPVCFVQYASKVRLRAYQIPVMQAVIDSVKQKKGLSFVVIFPRQSGKNELQANIETYLLTLFSGEPAEMIKVSPTERPQAQNAMRRLERTLIHNNFIYNLWSKEEGHSYRIGEARITFLSAAPESSIVGATASLLLEVDEAQDVLPGKYDKDIAPMAASTNATRVFWGTAWTAQTLLARELRVARNAEAKDGIKRAFVLTAEDVAAEVPAYGAFIAAQIARLGRDHPTIRTQFFSEEIDAESGLFPPARQALMQGNHPRQDVPSAGCIYAFLLDVAGEAVPSSSLSPTERRDSNALTVVSVEMPAPSTLSSLPLYRVVNRRSWVGTSHTQLLSELRALVTLWQPRYLVVDSTGVGAGLASFLESSLPCHVIRFLFTTASKSRLGWDFLSICDTARFQDYAAADHRGVDDFTRQLSHCRYTLTGGSDQHISWGVPEGTRDPADGAFIHDDWIMSAALVTQLERLSWPLASGPLVLPAADPLKEMDQGF